MMARASLQISHNMSLWVLITIRYPMYNITLWFEGCVRVIRPPRVVAFGVGRAWFAMQRLQGQLAPNTPHDALGGLADMR